MKPVLYRYRDSESVIKHMDGYTPGEGWEPLYSQDQVDQLQAQLVRQQKSYEAEIKVESEERLQNCAALVAENEQLRKDAERYQWLAEYLVSDDESYDDAIVAATTVKEVDSVIDNAMGASPWAHCFCGVRPQAQHVWQAATDAALERAAEVCETILDELSFANAYECSNECASAIRALKEQQ